MYFCDTYPIRFADWDESKVKRDEGGRFTFKNFAKAVSNKIKEAIVRITAPKTLNQWIVEAEKYRGQNLDRKDFEKIYGTKCSPIAVIPQKHMSKFLGESSSNLVMCSQAYLMDHILRHHPQDVPSIWYQSIQKVIDTGEAFVSRKSQGRKVDALLFAKPYIFQKNGKKHYRMLFLGLEVSNDSGIGVVFFKSLRDGTKTP